MASDAADTSLSPAETFAALQTLLVSIGGVDTFLTELAALAVHVAVPPVSCGITVEYDGHPLTVSASDSWAVSLDETQYVEREGPCLQSMRTAEVVHVTDLEQEGRWPTYTERALAKGLKASLSLPLLVDGRSVGALNLYSGDLGQRFTGEVRTRCEMFAAQASTALVLALRQLRQSEINEQLERALTSRSVIDQAIGIIMAQQRCSPDEAFDYLRAHSQNNNRLLREVAADLVGRIRDTTERGGR